MKETSWKLRGGAVFVKTRSIVVSLKPLMNWVCKASTDWLKSDCGTFCFNKSIKYRKPPHAVWSASASLYGTCRFGTILSQSATSLLIKSSTWILTEDMKWNLLLTDSYAWNPPSKAQARKLNSKYEIRSLRSKTFRNLWFKHRKTSTLCMGLRFWI